MDYTPEEFKQLYQNNTTLKGHLRNVRNALMDARVRFAAEETEVASETVEAMARVTRAVDWFREHENDMDEVDNAEECRQHLAALQLLPHIINDEAGADTVREYMTMPGEDQEELRKHLNGLQEMKLYFSADKPAFMDPECHDYFVSRLKAGEDWERRQENYQFLLDCMLGAGNKIKFESDEDKIEYTTYYAALLALKTGAGVRTMMKDEKGDPMVDKNNQPKYVQVDDVAEAIELLADKDFNNFLYKKYKTVGDDNKSVTSVFEFLNREVKRSNLVAYKNQKLKNEISFLRSTVNKEIENETKRAGEWIVDIKEHNETKNYFERGDGESGYTTNQHMLAQILAVRDLADAAPGDDSNMTTRQISAEKLAERVDEIENDSTHFLNNFVQSFYYADEEFNNLTKTVENSLYCAELDTNMKRQLLKMDGGQLCNTPVYRRYLPTVKERIEELQKQAKRTEDETKLARIAAEIVVLRNLGHAHRGKKSSLNKPIPTDGANSLVFSAQALGQDPNFRRLVMEKKDLITKGHGGQLVDEMREYAETLGNEVPPKELKTLSKALLYKNTIGGRMAQIRLEAARIKKQIDKERKSEDPDQEKLLKLQEKGNKLILEYSVIHDESRRTVNGRPVGNGANIRWNDVNAAMARRLGTPRYALLEGAGSVEQTGNALHTLARNSPEDYFNRQLINHDEEPKLVLNRIEDDLINKERQSEKSNGSEPDDMNRTIDSIDLDAEEEKKQIAENELKMNTNLI